MALVRNFKASTGSANTVSLTWDQPLGFNSTNDELIITRTITHPPVELYNALFPNRATDPRGVEIYRGSTITGTGGPFSNTKSLIFNGTDEWLLVPNNSNIDFNGLSDAFSISLWVKADNLADFKTFVSTRTTTTGTVGFEFGKAFTDDFSLIMQGVGTPGADALSKRTTDSPLVTGTWLHLVATYDGSGNASGIKLYTNGVENAFQVTVNNLSTSSAGGNDLGIGARYSGQNANKGNMDEVSIFNTALTATQVLELYNSGTANNVLNTSAASSLVSWWQMGDQTNGTTVPDIAGGGNDATMQNMDLSNVDVDVSNPLTESEGFLDGLANYPTSPSLSGRLLRDANSTVHRILSNTAKTIELDGEAALGTYVILPDFPTEERVQENYEFDARTISDVAQIENLVVLEDGTLKVKVFEPGELANLIFMDANGDKFVVKDNTETVVTFFGSDTPQVGLGMTMLASFFDSQPLPYIDSFLTEAEAAARTGTKLLNNQFYYYTIFTKEIDTNVARAEFATTDSGVSTQSFAISTDDTMMSDCLYKFWPSLARELDETGDLEDLMKVFGFQLNETHALIDTYNLQDPDNVLITALQPLSEQTGLPSVGFSIGADTLRRIARDMIGCWKLKGSKEGIALFIRKITTWDITNGTADFGGAIQDFLPNVDALRFFDPNLGSLNTRITQTSPFIAGGRFAKSLPGIVIPGFFTFREFVVDIPNVALYLGNSEGFTTGAGTTTMEDTTANFGANDSLVGNFLIPNSEEINDIFEIVANTATTITVRGTINNRNTGGDYAVLSPLNANRFQILNNLLPVYIPFGTRAGFRFVNI